MTLDEIKETLKTATDGANAQLKMAVEANEIEVAAEMTGMLNGLIVAQVLLSKLDQ